MSTNYSDDIKRLELEYQLENQKIALKRVDIECLKLKKKIEDYDATRESLYKEIEITKEKLASLKGGEK